MPKRCTWVPEADPLYACYHDEEWGVPIHDDRRLFETLCLDGAQAGLSWRTILHRREGYRQAFARFDPEILASWGEAEVARLMQDPGIVRNEAKIRSVIQNARALLRLTETGPSFGAYLWGFVEGRTVVNVWPTSADIPATSPEATAMSRDLKRRGFSFVGPTICYAAMQAAGLVNDHEVGCFRHAELQKAGSH